MSQVFSFKQISASVGLLFANYFYHHKHQIRVTLDMDPQPENPTIQTDPPSYTFDSQFEAKIDQVVKEIETYAAKKQPVEVGDQLEYKGDYTKKSKSDPKIYPNGKGVYYAKNNQFKMIGNFTDGVVNGPALFRYPDGSVVKTEFKNGEINGPGIRYLDEMRFEGNLVDGKPKGSGVYSFEESGKIYVKEEDGVEKAKCYDDNGRLWYRGEYSQGQCNGEGEFFFKNGNKYEGEFKQGKMDGVGKLKDRYGDVMYSGVFQNDAVGNRWKLYTEPMIVAGIVLFNLAPLLRKSK